MFDTRTGVSIGLFQCKLNFLIYPLPTLSLSSQVHCNFLFHLFTLAKHLYIVILAISFASLEVVSMVRFVEVGHDDQNLVHLDGEKSKTFQDHMINIRAWTKAPDCFNG